MNETTSPAGAWLELPCCPACGRWLFAGRRFCADHPDQAPIGRRLSGSGTVYSFTVSHAAMHPDVAELVPYAVALVETDEGPRLLAHVEPGTRPRIGDRVRLVEADAGTPGAWPGAGHRLARPATGVEA